MSVDWDGLVLGPLMTVFGEGDGTSPTPITYRPVTGAPYGINGVFDAAYVDITLNDPTSEINSTKPVLGVQISAMRAMPVENDQLFIPSVNNTYIVRDVQADGHGAAKLMLNKVRVGP